MVGSILSGISGALSAGAGLTGSILNYNMAKNTLNYQKNLQQQIFNREDNAVQRRVADLKAAGLSPMLAAGNGAAAGAAINVSSPELNTNQFASALTDAVNNAVANYKHSEESKLISTQRKKNNADTELTNAQTLNAIKQGQMFDYEIDRIKMDNASTGLNLLMLLDKTGRYFKYGIDTNGDITNTFLTNLGRFIDFGNKPKKPSIPPAPSKPVAIERRLRFQKGPYLSSFVPYDYFNAIDSINHGGGRW